MSFQRDMTLVLMTDGELDSWIINLRGQMAARRERGYDVHLAPLYPALIAAIGERALRDEEGLLP